METSLKTFEHRVRSSADPAPEAVAAVSIPRAREARPHRQASSHSLDDSRIRSGESDLRNLAHFMSQSVWVVASQGSAEYFNPYWESYTGLSEEESLYSGWTRAFHSDDLDAFLKMLRNSTEGGGFEFEARLRRASDGSYRRHVCRCSALPKEYDRLAKLLICCTDVEDWRNSAETGKEQAALLGLSVRTHDEEKRKIAHALHDSAGQYLVALSMKLEALQRGSGNTARRNPFVDECRELVKRCSGELRAISYLLHPPLLDDLGLESAVRFHVDGFIERTKIRVELDTEPNLGRLDRDVETALFRVVQEALTNIHRQAAGQHVRIKIGASPTGVFVEVTASGGMVALPGKFPASPRTSLGLGIAMIRERIREIGGVFGMISLADNIVIRAAVPRKALVAQACD